MAIITDPISQKLRLAGVEVFFVSRSATKWWNARRSDRKTEIALLGGYYWTYKGHEAGPFRTPSAAWRDAYYREVLHTEPPVMDQQDLARSEREIAAERAKEKRRTSRTRTVRSFVEA